MVSSGTMPRGSDISSCDRRSLWEIKIKETPE